MSEEIKTQEQPLNSLEVLKEKERKNKAEHLAPWQFKPGQSGNPGGRPKGSSMKVWAQNMLMEMEDKERQEFLKGIAKSDIWKMAEGNPHSTADVKATMTMADVLKEIQHGNKVIGQTVEDSKPLQNTGQEEKSNNVPTQQSPGTLQPVQVVEKYNPQE